MASSSSFSSSHVRKQTNLGQSRVSGVNQKRTLQQPKSLHQSRNNLGATSTATSGFNSHHNSKFTPAASRNSGSKLGRSQVGFGASRGIGIGHRTMAAKLVADELLAKLTSMSLITDVDKADLNGQSKMARKPHVNHAREHNSNIDQELGRRMPTEKPIAFETSYFEALSGKQMFTTSANKKTTDELMKLLNRVGYENDVIYSGYDVYFAKKVAMGLPMLDEYIRDAMTTTDSGRVSEEDERADEASDSSSDE